MSVRKAFVNISSAILGLTVMGGNVMAGEKVNQKACKTAVEAFEAAGKNMTSAMNSGNEKKLEVASDQLAIAATKIAEKCDLPIEDAVNLTMLPMLKMDGMAEQPAMAEMKAKGEADLLKARQAAGLTK